MEYQKNKMEKQYQTFDKYKPWEKEEYSGKLNYTLDDGNEYEIYREFKKKDTNNIRSSQK